MALVKCIECKSEVSDRAATCPRCGIANPSGIKREGTLLIKRASKFINCGVKYSYHIDGACLGQISDGARENITLGEGTHTIHISQKVSGVNAAALFGSVGFMLQASQAIAKGGAEVYKFEIISGKTTVIDFEATMGSGKVSVNAPA